MRENYNACTPVNRKFIIVMGTDDYGWAAYEIEASSVLVAKDMAERRELRRRRLVDLEKASCVKPALVATT
jgi:hypothetical protein